MTAEGVNVIYQECYTRVVTFENQGESESQHSDA